MGALRSWLRTRLGRSASPAAAGSVNLLGEPLPAQAAPTLKAPARLGIDTTLKLRPWSVARLAAIFQTVQRRPTEESLLEGRHARHCLSSFWLTAPVDLLESLYGGAVGDLQRRLLEGCLPSQPLAADEQAWRDQLSARLQDRFSAPDRLPLLLALMPYFPPQGLTVADPLDNLPDWLLPDYAAYCDPELEAQLKKPAGLLRAAAQAGEMPLLSERRGEAALAWLGDGAAVNRLAALINLYSLEPGDAATLVDLAELRRVLAQLWLDVSSEQLEQLYRTPAGTLYRSLISSGFGRELVQEQDGEVRAALASRVTDLSQPGAINNLLAALLYYPLGKVEFEGGQEFIPAWLLQELRTL